MIKFVSYQDAEIESVIEELSVLRSIVFREYPYLYEAQPSDESAYLATLRNASAAFLCLAYDETENSSKRVIGACTAMPSLDASTEVKEALLKAGYQLSDLSYFGESVILAPWRGRGIGSELMRRRLTQAQHWGMPSACFCAVERASPPPPSYRDPRLLWSKYGFRELNSAQCAFHWPDLGSQIATPKVMKFWLRDAKKEDLV